MTRPDVCIECQGSGWIYVAHRVVPDVDCASKCPDCGGSGRQPVAFDTGTTASDVDDFLNQIANDAMDGRGTE